MDRELGFLVAELDRAVRAWLELPGDRRAGIRVRLVWRLLCERGPVDELVAGWCAADDRGELVATRRMTWVLAELGDPRGARDALARAAAGGDLPVLGWLLAQPGGGSRRDRARHAEALRRQQQAADAGDPEAAYRIALTLHTEERRLAQLLDDLIWYPQVRGWRKRPPFGDAPPPNPPVISDEERETLLHRSSDLSRQVHRLIKGAVEAEYPEALLWEGKWTLDNTAGQDWPSWELAQFSLPELTRADELGVAEAARHRAVALAELARNRDVIRVEGNEVQAAEAALRRAEARGDPEAATGLGLLLSGCTPKSPTPKYGWVEEGTPVDWDGAEAAFRRAVELDYTEHPWSDLAECLQRRGDRDSAAEEAWRRATDRDEEPALYRIREAKQTELEARATRLAYLRRKYRGR